MDKVTPNAASGGFRTGRAGFRPAAASSNFGGGILPKRSRRRFDPNEVTIVVATILVLGVTTYCIFTH